jgi:TatD DNase family protein
MQMIKVTNIVCFIFFSLSIFLDVFINIHTHKELYDASVELVSLSPADKEKPNFYSYGIHPWYIKNNYEEMLDRMHLVSRDRRCIAIGECGLDKLVNIDIELQTKIFKEQVQIANELDKPLVIHCVKAFNELIHVLKENHNKVPVIIHGFNNNQNIAQALLKEGMYLSFGKALLTFGSNAAEAIKNVGRNNFFLETDDADISIKYIYHKAAELLGIDVEILQEQLKRNFQKVFKEEIM